MANPADDPLSEVRAAIDSLTTMKVLALRCPAGHFGTGPAGRFAWGTVKEEALKYGVEMSLEGAAKVTVRSRGVEGRHFELRTCVENGKDYTLPELIEFAYNFKNGNFISAMEMWREMQIKRTTHNKMKRAD